MSRFLPLAAIAILGAAMLVAGGPGSALDRILLYEMQREALVPAARLATRLGDGGVLLAITALAAAFLALARHRRPAIALIAISLGCRLVVELQKGVFDRARPDPEGHLIAVHTMAFPSGHAANSAAVFLGLALLAPLGPGGRIRAVAAALLLSLLVGLSRIVLGVHWPSDVAGGWAFGALWALLLARAAGTSPPERH